MKGGAYECVDFYRINVRSLKGNKLEVYPEYKFSTSKDLMTRGGAFYAIYDRQIGKWTTEAFKVVDVVDQDIRKKVEELTAKENHKLVDQTTSLDGEEPPKPKKVVGGYLENFSSTYWLKFVQYVKNVPDNFVSLDNTVTFKGAKTKKSDYVSKELPYELSNGSCDAWNELMSILYDPVEREKIEWAIGSVLAGDAKEIQKFLVLYGPPGSGKGTVLEIIKKLFEGYCTEFKAESLVSSSDQFNCKFLSSNPLVAIDSDTNLRKIETNATINKIASHEELEVNEKYKSQYIVKPICMMFLGTNKPVQITDAKSGIIRRLIDVEPSGRKIQPTSKYKALVKQIGFELGAIAKHCLDVYNDPNRGMYYYDDYFPERMVYRTDAFYNFMEDNYYDFLDSEYISATRIWKLWKEYCDESGIQFTRKRYEIIDEAKNYFREFTKEPTHVKGEFVRDRFIGLRTDKFINDDGKRKDSVTDNEKKVEPKKISEADVSGDQQSDQDFPAFGWLKLDQTKSLLDDILAEYPAQYETDNPEYPLKYKWDKVKTKLKHLDTSKTHYVKGPGTLIFVDFDKHGADGKKDLKKNLEVAGSDMWKPTYAELSNSGGGIHLLYWYDGDVNDLSSIFDDEIEIKTYPEDQLRSMRRRVSLCNNLPIAHISSGLPKKEKKVINWDGVKDDKHLRNIILQAIKKECRPYGEEPKTVTCVKYIRDILQQAQANGMSYDVRDLEEAIYAFAAHSHNNKEECIRMFYDMELMWPKQSEPVGTIFDGKYEKDSPIIILDCEVVKNLTLVVYKELEPDGVAGILKENGPDKKCIRMYNPKPNDIERLMSARIVGHNVTGYDNFILWAIYLGYSPEEIFNLSQDIIVHGNRVPWREAKNLSYTDTYDVSSDKKGLKKIEIEMHLPHKEMEIDWSEPLPESEWERLATYCENDVLATEAYFLSKGWQADFKARKILAALTGMTVNDSTNNLTAQLNFGDTKEPWHDFVYPDLKKEFPEYRFENGKSYYGDVVIGEGGRVYAEPGGYYNVKTFDVAGMHPTSIITENGFGPWTKNYRDLYEARIAIKHKDYDSARKMFNGRLAPYLESDDDADALSHALKIALNSVYGMTAAHFQNRFKDPRNVDNWVAKRGALFMEKLRREVQSRGGHVIHIKTDSIKLVNPTKELEDFVIDFGKKYGYTFEVESIYDRICLVNHAVYIAYRSADDPGWLKECAKAKKKAEKEGKAYIEPTRWTATGQQFAHPYIFKRLFSKEPMEFWDFCEIKTVKTSLYLDMNESLKDVSQEEKEKAKILTRIRKLEKTLETDLSLTDADKAKIHDELVDLPKDIDALNELIAEGHYYQFVGKAGEFVPVKPGLGGGLLMRKEDDGSYGYATGAKGYRWLESEVVHHFDNWKEYIDMRYFRKLADVAIKTINAFTDFEMFVKGDEYVPEEHGEQIREFETDPWVLPCGTEKYAFCSDCPNFSEEQYGYCCKLGYNISEQILGE